MALIDGITRDALAALSGRTVLLLDVRSPTEFAQGSIAGAKNVPAERVATEPLPADVVVVTVCNHGGSRSQGAAAALRARGVEATDLVGGVKGAKAGH